MSATDRGGLEASPALDIGWLEDRMSRLAWRPRDRVERVGRIEVLYSSVGPKRIVVLYRAALRARGVTRHALYTGIIVPPAKLAGLVRTLTRTARAAPIGRAVIPLPEAHAVLLAYPNDTALRLPAGARTARQLAARLLGRRRGGTRVVEAAFELLRYVPERRWTARCRCVVTEGVGRRRAATAIVKQFARPERARRCYESLSALGPGPPAMATPRAAPPAGAPVRIARVLGFEAAAARVWIESLPGRTLEERLGRIDLEPVMAGLGRSLAAFHRGRTALARELTPEGERQRIDEALEAIAAAFPDLERRLARIAPGLGRARDGGPPGVLHGSLRLNHVLVHRGRLAFVDLDGARMGPPAYDLANLLASLYYLESEERITRDVRTRTMRCVMDGYTSIASRQIPPRTLLGFVADLLVAKQAVKYATRLRRDRRTRLERMLDLAEQFVSLARRPPAGSRAWSALP